MKEGSCTCRKHAQDPSDTDHNALVALFSFVPPTLEGYKTFSHLLRLVAVRLRELT